MTDPSPTPNTSPRKAGRWQVGLRALILLTAAIAVWMTSHVNRRESERLEARIKVMQPLARDLRIDDPSQAAVVKLVELWMDDSRWDLYLPAGEYRVCLATRGIASKGLPPVKKSSTIKAGRHRLELEVPRKEGDRSIRLTSDGVEVLAFEEAKDWGFSTSSSGAGNFTKSAQQPPDQPLILYQRQYMVPIGTSGWTTPSGPADGIMVWIEPVPKPQNGVIPPAPR